LCIKPQAWYDLSGPKRAISRSPWPRFKANRSIYQNSEPRTTDLANLCLFLLICKLLSPRYSSTQN
jgi:hypothetical protein